MKKFFFFLLLIGGAGYLIYQSYIKGHPGADGSAAGRGMSRMRGNSRELEEAGK